MSDKNQVKPEKKTGLAHLLAATTYSIAGLQRMLKEAAFRHEIAFFVAILICLIIATVPASNYLIATILGLLMLAVETLNTAIEEIVDKISPEFSSFAKVTKDLGSFAVFTMLVANGFHALWAIFLT